MGGGDRRQGGGHCRRARGAAGVVPLAVSASRWHACFNELPMFQKPGMESSECEHRKQSSRSAVLRLFLYREWTEVSNDCRSTGRYGAIKANSCLRSSATYSNWVPSRRSTFATKDPKLWRTTVSKYSRSFWWYKCVINVNRHASFSSFPGFLSQAASPALAQRPPPTGDRRSVMATVA